MNFFTQEFRENLLKELINKAKNDERISSCALVGSYSLNKQDRWSDIDLTFGVKEQYDVKEVLESWTESLLNKNKGSILFDITRGGTTYRVFLLENCLQVDISFSNQNDFGPVANTFKLLFGSANEKKLGAKLKQEELFCYFVHHILRARICIERGKKWQALFWINEARNYVFKIYCIENGLNADYGREYDLIDPKVLEKFENTIPQNLNSETLQNCLSNLVNNIGSVSTQASRFTKNVQKQLFIIATK